MKTTTLILILLAAVAANAQSVIGRWHLLNIPVVKIFDKGHSFLTITKDSLWIAAEQDASGTDEPGGGSPSFFAFKIVSFSSTTRADTVVLVVKDKKKYQTLRLAANGDGMYTLSVDEDRYSKIDDAKNATHFVDFLTLISDERYTAMQRGKDPTTITDEEIIAILTALRSEIGNRKAAHNFKKEMKQSMGFALLNPLTFVIGRELEMLGYNPFHWSKTPQEIIESRIANQQIAQLVEELRQMTKKL